MIFPFDDDGNCVREKRGLCGSARAYCTPFHCAPTCIDCMLYIFGRYCAPTCIDCVFLHIWTLLRHGRGAMERSEISSRTPALLHPLFLGYVGRWLLVTAQDNPCSFCASQYIYVRFVYLKVSLFR